MSFSGCPRPVLPRGPADVVEQLLDVDLGFGVDRRWVLERTFAWLGRSRRLAKDWEKSIASAEA